MTPTVVMLHGINGSQREMQPFAALLRPHAQVLTPNLLGHGGRHLPERFSVAAWAGDLLAQLDAAGVGRAVLVGYSLGGYIALYLARHHPERVTGVLSLATKHLLDDHYQRLSSMLANPERARQMPPEAVEALRDTHHPQDWKAVLLKNRQFFLDLSDGPPLSDDDLRAIRCPVLVINGDRDQIVSLQESEGLAGLLPQSRGLWFHGAAHPLDAVPLRHLAPHVLHWLAETGAQAPV